MKVKEILVGINKYDRIVVNNGIIFLYDMAAGELLDRCPNICYNEVTNIGIKNTIQFNRNASHIL